MSLKFYNSYRKAFAKKPVEDWQMLMQAAIDDTWEDTSTIRTVNGQKAVGGYEYGCESVQLNSVVNAKTGEAFGDDYRKIIYREIARNSLPPDRVLEKLECCGETKNCFDPADSQRWLGKYYKFDGAVWLTTNTSTVIGALNSAILRRCNNLLKWIDSEGGLHSWACVFDRTLSSTNFDTSSEGVPQVKADAVICVQRNAETDTIPYNQRFIFDGWAFQVKQINNHVSNTYMELYVFETQVRTEDDLVNNIADGGQPIISTTTEILFEPNGEKILEGETLEFTVFSYINGIKTKATFTASASGPVEGVNYTLSFVGGNNFTITNLAQSDIPLTVICTDSLTGQTASMEVILGGKW